MTVEEWLIEAVKIRPIIWDIKDKTYKNTKLKNEAYDEIAKESNLTVDEIKRKWHSIRSAFSRELRMRNLISTTTAGPNNEKRVWKHFNKLMFLQEDCQDDEQELDDDENNYTTISIVTDLDTSNILNQQSISSNNNTANNLEFNHSSLRTNTTTNNNNLTTTTLTTTTNNHKQPSTKKRKTTSQLTNELNNNKFMNNNNNNNNNSFHSKFNSLSEEEIFGHSIAASLKKFDPKKQEIVKLRLQEVIVQHLQED